MTTEILITIFSLAANYECYLVRFILLFKVYLKCASSLLPNPMMDLDDCHLEDAHTWAIEMHRSLQASINKSLNFAHETAADAKRTADTNTQDIAALKLRKDELESKVDRLEKRLIGLEAYGRRENLLLHEEQEVRKENRGEKGELN